MSGPTPVPTPPTTYTFTRARMIAILIAIAALFGVQGLAIADVGGKTPPPVPAPSSAPVSSVAPSSSSPSPSPSTTVSATPSSTANVPCLPSPAACNLPDGTNTGATGTLTVHAGNLKTTANGQVIANLDIQGCLQDVNSDVVIQNVKIEGGCNWSLDAHLATGPLTLTNVTVLGSGSQSAAIVVHNDVSATGLNASGGNDVFDVWGGIATVAGSYLHNPARNAAGNSHDDAVQITGGTGVFTADTLIAVTGTDPNNACVQVGDLSGNSGGFTLTGSLCDGGNYSLNANATAVKAGKVTSGPLVFTGNRFGTGYRYGVKANLGSPFSTTWSGNVNDANGALLP